MVIWLTGLSGAGKTTVCRLLQNKLNSNGYSVEWFDGDRIRKELRIESDFSRKCIIRNNFEVVNRIKQVKDKFDFILISLISPLQEVRENAKKTFNENYFEIYVKCDKSTLIKRDTKGLYKKALGGEIDNLIGFSDKVPYEEPLDPDLTLETNLISPDQSVEIVYYAIMSRLK